MNLPGCLKYERENLKIIDDFMGQLRKLFISVPPTFISLARIQSHDATELHGKATKESKERNLGKKLSHRCMITNLDTALSGSLLTMYVAGLLTKKLIKVSGRQFRAAPNYL